MNKVVSMEEMIPLIKNQLEAGGKATFTPKGKSMLPMLRDGMDTVTIARAKFPLKKYDLPLYQRKDGSYVLHRVVDLSQGKYVMRGDGQFVKEYGIEESQIIGVVVAFTRKGKKHSCQGLGYRIYVKVWVATVGLRKIKKKGRRILGRIKRKILG